jgi:hypothetical protein
MSELRLRKPPAGSVPCRRPRLEIPRLAHNWALHYLATEPIGDELREQLMEVARGFTSRCNKPLAPRRPRMVARALPPPRRGAAVLKKNQSAKGRKNNGQIYRCCELRRAPG